MKELFEIIKSDWLFYSEIKKVLKKMIATKKSENEWFYDELKNVIKNKTSDEYDEEINSYINLISN
jgi:hypothetical protein